MFSVVESNERSFGGDVSNLESVSKGKHPLGNAFFFFLLPIPRKRKGIASTMVMGLGLTREFWNFATMLLWDLVEIFSMGPPKEEK